MTVGGTLRLPTDRPTDRAGAGADRGLGTGGSSLGGMQHRLMEESATSRV